MTHSLSAKEQTLAKIFGDDCMFSITACQRLIRPGFFRHLGPWKMVCLKAPLSV
ncbi:hypothetical protein OS176_00555 [Xanthomonadaceae bacterium XH05]|nr:hypothetical protein [Xanthomonadaceae bacterium XH05]